MYNRYDIASEAVILKAWRDTLTGIFSYCCCCFRKQSSAARVATEDFELARQQRSIDLSHIFLQK